MAECLHWPKPPTPPLVVVVASTTPARLPIYGLDWTTNLLLLLLPKRCRSFDIIVSFQKCHVRRCREKIAGHGLSNEPTTLRSETTSFALFRRVLCLISCSQLLACTGPSPVWLRLLSPVVVVVGGDVECGPLNRRPSCGSLLFFCFSTVTAAYLTCFLFILLFSV